MTRPEAELLDNQNPEHRQALIAALAARGLEAHEERSGGNVWHVSVYLLKEASDWLAISTATEETACDVGLMGERGGRAAGEARWEPVDTLAAAVAAFERRWNDQDEWTAQLRVGDLDL